MSKAVLTIFAVAVLLTALFSVAAQENPPEASPADSVADSAPLAPRVAQEPSSQLVFNKIELSTEGVVAYDSLGRRWYYDFNDEAFAEDRRAAARDERGREPGSDEQTADPVEIRCTEPLYVERPSLKAVYVGLDEFVDGDIVAYGRVTIKGWVKGDVQSFNKRVLVTATGQVDGDIRAPEIEVKRGGVVLGRQIVTNPISVMPEVISTQFSAAGVWIVFGFTLALTLLVFLATSLAPRQITRVVICIREYRSRTFLLGFVLVIALPIIITLLSLTIVGVVGVALIPLACLVALAFGMAAVTRPLLKLVFGHATVDRTSLLAQSLAGVALYMAVWMLVALLLGSGGPRSELYSNGLGIALLVIAIIATIYPLFTGVGAVTLTRFGFRDYVPFKERTAPEERPATAPAPPPMPDIPLRPRSVISPPPLPSAGSPSDRPGPPKEN